jgi:hypothetical protein
MPAFYGVFAKNADTFVPLGTSNGLNSPNISPDSRLIIFDKNIANITAQGIQLVSFEPFRRRNWSSASPSWPSGNSLDPRSSTVTVLMKPVPGESEMVEVDGQKPFEPGFYLLGTLGTFNVRIPDYLSALWSSAKVAANSNNFQEAFDLSAACDSLFQRYLPGNVITPEAKKIELAALIGLSRAASASGDEPQAEKYAQEIQASYDSRIGRVLLIAIRWHGLDGFAIANDWNGYANAVSALVQEPPDLVSEALRAYPTNSRFASIEDALTLMVKRRDIISEPNWLGTFVSGFVTREDKRLLGPAVAALQHELDNRKDSYFSDIYNSDTGLLNYIWYIGKMRAAEAQPALIAALETVSRYEYSRDGGANVTIANALADISGDSTWRNWPTITPGGGYSLFSEALSGVREGRARILADYSLYSRLARQSPGANRVLNFCGRYGYQGTESYRIPQLSFDNYALKIVSSTEVVGILPMQSNDKGPVVGSAEVVLKRSSDAPKQWMIADVGRIVIDGHEVSW